MQVMQSNKWTFSLTSLVVILALAFVGSSAMAGEFGVSLDMMNDISHADGLQLPTAATIALTVKFDKAVVLAAGDVTVSNYDMNGVFLAPNATAPAIDPATAAKEITITVTIATGATRLTLRTKKGIASADAFNEDTSKEGKWNIDLLSATNPAGTPDVLKIALVGEPFSPITSATFMVHILLTEEPKGGFNKDLLELSELDLDSIVKLVTPVVANVPAIPAVDRNGNGNTTDDGEPAIAAGAAAPSWRDGNLHLYLVTLKTKPGEKTAKIKVKSFAGMERPTTLGGAQEMYNQLAGEGRDMLTVKTKTAGTPATAKAAGLEVYIPKEKRILDYLVIAKNIGGSGIQKPDDSDKDAPKIDKRTPAQLMYNIIEVGIPNLETFLANGGTIDLVAPNDLVISEIMWGSDASLDPDNNSQWIEIKNNTGSSILTGDKTHKLVFYGPNETLPDVSTVKDRVGTVGAGGYWSIMGKGQGGRSGEGETATDVVAVVPTQALISMQRVIDATAGAADGTMASSWAASTPPALNFDVAKVGIRVASPGATPVAYPTAPAPAPAPEPAPPATPAATAADIAITEIMVDTGGGRLPQWIELTNTSSAAVSLSDWSVVIDNATDADVYGGGAPVTVSIGDVELGVGEGVGNGDGQGQSVLLVAWSSRNSENFNEDRVVNLATQLKQTGRYQLLSYMGFRITLVPKQTSPVLASGDDVGNLGMNWEIPMGEDGRSSLIRMEMDSAGMATMGTSAAGWKLASDTDLISGPTSWYGSDEDAGTPGYDSGGPLPVELSMFYPKRDQLTGQVVITWETQSELNNAGFFIKRSEAKDGEFKVINATMIAGAGTTSEKQSYTYTDTSAKPNVVYYYQIEDVSLDGQRQTLTLGTRLRGHIGAAGKATTTWGELKKVQE